MSQNSAPPNSVRLYITSTNIHHSDGKDTYFKIIGSCERVAFKIKNSEHWHVRYQNNAYRLHTPKNMKKILKLAAIGKIKLEDTRSSNSQGLTEALSKLAPSYYFTLEKSPGHFYRFF